MFDSSQRHAPFPGNSEILGPLRGGVEKGAGDRNDKHDGLARRTVDRFLLKSEAHAPYTAHWHRPSNDRDDLQGCIDTTSRYRGAQCGTLSSNSTRNESSHRIFFLHNVKYYHVEWKNQWLRKSVFGFALILSLELKTHRFPWRMFLLRPGILEGTSEKRIQPTLLK